MIPRYPHLFYPSKMVVIRNFIKLKVAAAYLFNLLLTEINFKSSIVSTPLLAITSKFE